MKEIERCISSSFSEEIYSDAIYSIKKNENGEISQRILKYATLDKVIDYLCFEIFVETVSDNNFMVVLFATYPSFTNSHTLFNMLVDRFVNTSRCSDAASKEVCRHIFNVFIYWMQKSSAEVAMKNIFDMDNPDFTKFYNLLTPEWKKSVDRRLSEKAYQRSNSIICYQVFSFMKSGNEEGSNPYSSMKESILDFEPKLIAEQLTVRDAQLLKRLDPCDCLGSIWGNRHKNSAQFKTTVRPTVENFNLICYAVQTTILTATSSPKRKTTEKVRAFVIEHWILVCNFLRELKNFSSLKAIISALSSTSIYSLVKTWSYVSKNLRSELKLYEELMSDDYNNQAVRDVLKIEGSSKVAVISVSNKNRKSHSSSKTQLQVAGTIPYLGTFLSDLIKIDTASPSYNSDGLINLDKKRKEFEVLCQLILYKSSVTSYSLEINSAFLIWLSNLKVLSESECNDMSKTLESPGQISFVHSRTLMLQQASKNEAPEANETVSSLDDISRKVVYKLSLPITRESLKHVKKFSSSQKLFRSASIVSKLQAKVSVLYNKIFSDIQRIELIDSLTTEQLINIALNCIGICPSNNTNKLYQFTENECILILPNSIVHDAIKKCGEINLLLHSTPISEEPVVLFVRSYL